MARETKTISRREMLRRSMALSTLATAQIAWPVWMPRLSFSQNGARGDVLVCIFLRGGADGLNIIVPHGDNTYYNARPTLSIPRPDDSRAGNDKRTLDLDGFFGLHPVMAPLLPIFKGGELVAVHGTGSPDPTRSHFDAMSFMERGTPGDYKVSTGWIGRHLASLDTGNDSPVRAVGWNSTLQQSLRGTVNAIALKSIIDYHLQGRKESADEMLAALNALYAADAETLKLAAHQTTGVLELISKINVAEYKPANGAAYNNQSPYHLALMQTAQLIKAEVGLEVSAIDLGGWDTHQNQDQTFPADLTELAAGLAAFHADMGDRMNNITVVVMSEFGRRIEENASGGTDHGHGNMMLVMGRHVVRKPVIAQWPGLQREQRYMGDDLEITTDYRDVLSEILMLRLNNSQIDAVFPGFKPTLRGVVLKD